MARVEITNGSGVEAKVTNDRELLVTVSQEPIFREQKSKPFRQFFVQNGTSDSDMGQDGSVTNLEFCISADPKNDVYMTHVSIAMGYGSSGQPFQFGDGAALINGVRFFYESLTEEVDIHDAIKSNQDLFRISSQHFESTWELRGIGGVNDYGYFITIPLTHFSPAFGVKLDAGSDQKIVFVVRDSMAAVSAAGDTFNAIAHGFSRFE